MREVRYNEYANEVLQAISKGAFLNVESKGETNTMTIAWGNLGYMWRKPVLTIMVRPSRYTYELLESTEHFTVSIPFEGAFGEALKICGTVSGKDTNKWEAANIKAIPAHLVPSVLVEGCDVHYECKIIGKTELTPGMLDQAIDKQFYNAGDYHVLYYGEIVGTYVKEEKES